MTTNEKRETVDDRLRAKYKRLTRDGKYKPEHGGYLVKSGMGGYIIRPTKLAAGMAYTRERSVLRAQYSRAYCAAHFSDDACTLSVRGTLVRSPLSFKLATVDSPPCSCCGATRRLLRLNERGKAVLRRKRRERQERLQSKLYPRIARYQS